jgi:uncharacterized delta-60 repeat protein
LDPNFGSGGVVRIDFGGPTTGNQDFTFAAAMQADSKVVVAGFTYAQSQGDSTSVIAVARLNTDGTLDSSFGTGGKVLTDLTGIGDQSWAVSIQVDGKILVAADTVIASQSVPALIRYNSDGGLDGTFGTSGIAYLNNAAGSVLDVMTVMADCKIIAGNGVGSQIVLYRFNSNGGSDTSFGTNGKLTKTCIATCYPHQLALQNDKLVVAGRFITGSNYPLLLRLTANGGYDFKFATKGRVIAGVRQGNFFGSVAIQADGGILVGGTSLLRYDTNGNFDRVFDPAPFGNFQPGLLAVAPDGKIIAAGGTNLPATNGFDLVTVVYGTGGNVVAWARTDLFGDDDFAASGLVQPDGKIVVVARAQTNTATLFDVVVVRYSSITP